MSQGIIQRNHNSLREAVGNVLSNLNDPNTSRHCVACCLSCTSVICHPDAVSSSLVMVLTLRPPDTLNREQPSPPADVSYQTASGQRRDARRLLKSAQHRRRFKKLTGEISNLKLSVLQNLFVLNRNPRETTLAKNKLGLTMSVCSYSYEVAHSDKVLRVSPLSINREFAKTSLALKSDS
jgi:hypothetical protein